jgi:phenylalanyl-tRNA synthetase alpha subunit
MKREDKVGKNFWFLCLFFFFFHFFFSGSIGWRYEWSEEESLKNLLRTHTTAVSSRMLYQLAQDTKVFLFFLLASASSSLSSSSSSSS